MPTNSGRYILGYIKTGEGIVTEVANVSDIIIDQDDIPKGVIHIPKSGNLEINFKLSFRQMVQLIGFKDALRFIFRKR